MSETKIGALRKMIAPLSHEAAQENLRRFTERSAVRDESGPRRVYTGTSKDKEFDVFKAGRRGAWFSEDPSIASSYATSNDSMGHRYDPSVQNFVGVNTSSRVIPAYLNIEKPYRLTEDDIAMLNSGEGYASLQRTLFDRLRAQGYDGVDFGGGTWVAFDPRQIKSAIGNAGTYDPTEKSMMKSRGGILRKVSKHV